MFCIICICSSRWPLLWVSLPCYFRCFSVEFSSRPYHFRLRSLVFFLLELRLLSSISICSIEDDFHLDFCFPFFVGCCRHRGKTGKTLRRAITDRLVNLSGGSRACNAVIQSYMMLLDTFWPFGLIADSDLLCITE